MVAFNRRAAGSEAEIQACKFLQAQGLHLLAQNYRCSFGEIDLIMRDKNDIVFVEVRSRNRKDYGNASESINKNKINKIIKTATFFLQMKKWLHTVDSRFDIVAIHDMAKQSALNGSMDAPLSLEWIKNAFSGE